MLDRYQMDLAGPRRDELVQYCKMENVSLADLTRTEGPGNTLKHRIKSTVFHLLQIVDKGLRVMMDRLSPELERKSMMQGRLS